MRRIGMLFGLGLLIATTGIARAGEADAISSTDEVVQMLADLTAIDQDCRTLSVDFGIGFRYAAAHGVSVTDVLPTGPRRAVFERDLNETEGETDSSVVCGALAQRYSTLVPGSVTFAGVREDP